MASRRGSSRGRKRTNDLAETAKEAGFRSIFEFHISLDLKEKEAGYKYEDLKIKFEQPAKIRTYITDFVLDNGIIVEAKGFLDQADRDKMVWIKEQNPDLDVRFLFQNAKNTITKVSKTTYGDWATKKGFIWAEGNKIPQEWINEKGN